MASSVGAAVIFSGCQPQRAAPTPEQRRAAEPFLSHVVQFQGETLSIIAGWYTGSAKNWELLKEANPGLNPNRIRLGDTIQIPRELVSREDPLPRSALPGGQKRGASAGSASGQGTSNQTGSSRSQADQSGSSASSVVERDMQDGVSDAAQQAQAEADRAAEQAAAEQAAAEQAAAQAAAESGSSDANQNAQRAEDATTGDASANNPDMSSGDTVAPSQPETKPEMRIKSRDELLKELLEE